MTKDEFETYLDNSKEIEGQINTNLIRTADLVRSFKQISVDQTYEERREFYLKSIGSRECRTNLKIDVDCDDELKIKSYPGSYSQIITNLIINSIRHGYDLDKTGVININFLKKDNYLILEYKDDGKGITKENLQHIFEPFFTTNREYGGTGLGLNVIYNIVTNNLKGIIKCSSELNKGTIFLITLPLD